MFQAWLIPKSARSFDKYLCKLQRFTTDAMGPITWLWDKMQQGSVDTDSARSAMQSRLLLMANASAHFNVERRKAIIKHLNTDIKFIAEVEFPDSGPYLFGEDFGKRAKAAADDVRAHPDKEGKTFFRERRLKQEVKVHAPESPP